MGTDEAPKAPENTPQSAARADHTHEHRFWHAHLHDHYIAAKRGIEAMTHTHDTGHYHSWAQTHEHGHKSFLTPHAHQAKLYHPGEEFKHHHATIDHEKGA